jgi:hypothetical protein
MISKEDEKWTKINSEKRRDIQLGQAINLIIGKYELEDLLSADENVLLKQINSVFNLIVDAETKILQKVPDVIANVNKEAGTLRLKLK